MATKFLRDFNNLYSVQKTLRFELRPQGKTLENIQKSGILYQDEHRADSYKRVTKIADEYHKAFIEKSLWGFELSAETLEEYYSYFKIPNKDELQKKKFEDVQTKLRKQIVKALTDSNSKRLFSKELIKEELPRFVTDEEDRKLIEEFKDFTTHFTGFHENRKNIYSDEAKSTAIAYRLIHENLPKFINNISVFEKVAKSPVADHFQQLYKDLEEYMNAYEIKDIFTLNYYSNVLTQTQISAYNLIIGGKTLEDGTKIQGLNEYINLYNQKQTDKNDRLPKFTILFKQILSDRKPISWLPEQFESGDELLKSIANFYEEISCEVGHSLKELLLNIDDFDLSKIYLRKDSGLTNISQRYLGNYDAIASAIKDRRKRDVPKSQKQKQENYDEQIEKFFDSADSFSIGFIDECLGGISVEGYFKTLGKKEGGEDLFVLIEQNYAAVKGLLNTPYPEDKDLKQDKANVEKIKLFLDSLKELQWFVKPLLGKGDEADREARFYGELDRLWMELDKVTPLYNMVRNFVTQKPYSQEKIKLNFENSTLLDGWDVNKERDNTGILLRKDGLYYLAIMDKKHNKVFAESLDASGECYEKIDYKLLPGANKMLPKVFFSDSRKGEFKPSEQLLENYKNETHKKGDSFDIDDCRNLIDFFKSSIQKHEDWKKFDFHFSNTAAYNDLGGFYREVESQGYKITFREISASYIDKLTEEGKIYLFQIYNKDFSPYSKGAPNMHTLYWRVLFDTENLKDVVYKLNGQAEVFYRKKSINYSKDELEKGHHYNELKDKFKYPIIKNRRYAFDKFQFHAPITLNFKAKGDTYINERVNRYIKEGNVKHIIGIDRGERHLLYLSLIDLKGDIVKQFSLNEIANEYNGNSYKTNYRDLLDEREEARDRARKSWQTIENIKELKEGYLSQVIHEIAQLIVQYDAIVVLEDLNFGFMRGRQKVEKQVYQKFEKMLIDKLNYLVDKRKTPAEEGGLLNAYQLTNKFTSFKDMGKQNGFLFYIPAWNTSKIDPVTGFVNYFDAKYESVEKAKEFFAKFADIRYNRAKNYFEFVVDNYTKFNSKAEETRQDWTICTNSDRIESFRNPDKNSNWDSRTIVLCDEFKKLFDNFDINYTTNLKQSIAIQTEKQFYERLLYLFRLTLQMRNSASNTDIDYIISPVADANGAFYDSRDKKESLPTNADANGAYNIARKGLWAIEQIKQAQDLKKVNLAISNKEWLRYAQNGKNHN